MQICSAEKVTFIERKYGVKQWKVRGEERVTY